MSKKGQDKLKMEVGWQVKKVPSTAFSFAENFPQALVYADKYLRQQQKNHYRLEEKQIFNEHVFANQQEDREGRRIIFGV